MAFVPESAPVPSIDVELSLACRGLSGSDILSKSDPMCVTYIQQFNKSQWTEFHRTETVKNNEDPNFVSKVLISYRFEERQPLMFEIYDSDSKSKDLSAHDFLGTVTTTLGQLVTTKRNKIQLKGRDDNLKQGFLIITVEELCSNNDEVILELKGLKLDKKDFFGKSDPFLEFFKLTDTGNYTLVHKTDVIKNTLSPHWKRFIIPIKILCNGDYDRTLKIICFDWNSSGDHSLIGEFHTTLKGLLEPNATFKCINGKKKEKKKDYTDSGEIYVTYANVEKTYSFLEYIQGGTEIHCTVAIDFTGSNGLPSHPKSLHFINNLTMNSYEQAIWSIVSIIEDYDTDKQFPVLGFGAKIPPYGQVSHEFFVNMSVDNPHCFSVRGVLDAYRNCIKLVQLYGPTNFAPVINHVTRIAQHNQGGNGYFILLILTDGVITDMQETVQAIVTASRLPISIIIVGIGNAEFDSMEELDSDKKMLKTVDGVKAERDIVQFVPFNKYYNQDPSVANLYLAKEVLAEVPKQFLSYMKSKGIIPKNQSANVPNIENLKI
ncbi:copine-8-like [Daktulosphaira vitifoliae]|uniref:copine-8-like n=1 Tax=Daktulosphaira vitifoliae TaxID=58002 RepID=UPI0021A9C7AF|nr:copine-8-like [Daktulosphaira vitifoliae]